MRKYKETNREKRVFFRFFFVFVFVSKHNTTYPETPDAGECCKQKIRRKKRTILYSFVLLCSLFVRVSVIGYIWLARCDSDTVDASFFLLCVCCCRLWLEYTLYAIIQSQTRSKQQYYICTTYRKKGEHVRNKREDAHCTHITNVILET